MMSQWQIDEQIEDLEHQVFELEGDLDEAELEIEELKRQLQKPSTQYCPECEYRQRKLDRIRKIAKEELRVISQEGGICGGYLKILAVLDADSKTD